MIQRKSNRWEHLIVDKEYKRYFKSMAALEGKSVLEFSRDLAKKIRNLEDNKNAFEFKL